MFDFMDVRGCVNKEQAINLLNKAIENMKEMADDTFFMLTIDLENESVSDCGRQISRQKGESIIKQSKTRIFSGNKYMSQLDLYSVFQPDIYNIKKEGIINTILLEGMKKNTCSDEF